MTKKRRQHLAAILGGFAIGGLLVTWIGKTVMEAGILVLSGFAAIGTGWVIGKLAFPRKRHASR